MRLKSWIERLSCILALAVLAHVISAPVSQAADEKAVLTEVHGQVYKRGFLDFVRKALAVPVLARVNDILQAGMQLGTGANSWAQITWSDVVARTWSNTVVQIMPHKRVVFLAKGEALFRKKKGSVSDLKIWTKVLQARVRGTTVLMQRSSTVTRVNVLEGYVDIYNLLDESTVHLGPGAVYEVATPAGDSGKKRDDGDTPDDPSQPGEYWAPFDPNWEANKPKRPTKGDLSWKPDEDDLDFGTRISRSDIQPVDLFKTPVSSSRLKVADCASILDHPLLNVFAKPIDSMPLIRNANLDLPDVCFSDRPEATKPLAQRNKMLCRSVQVLRGPAGVKFQKGKELGFKYAMPNPFSAGAQRDRSTTSRLPARKYDCATLKRMIAAVEKEYHTAREKLIKFRQKTEWLHAKKWEELEAEAKPGMHPDVFKVKKDRICKWHAAQKPKQSSLSSKVKMIESRLQYLERQYKAQCQGGKSSYENKKASVDDCKDGSKTGKQDCEDDCKDGGKSKEDCK